MKKLIVASLMIVALAVGGVVSAFSQPHEVGGQGEKHHKSCLDQLTEEQREALTQMIEELRDAGATPEEISEAVQQFLEDLGINTEECRVPSEELKPKNKERKSCLDQLTEEQREALTQMIEELRDAGATPEEISEAVQQFLEDLGINTEECRVPMDEFRHRNRERTGNCLDQLTEEQREALTQMIQELKDAGATPEEISEAVQQFLEDLGIDTENCQVPPDGTPKSNGTAKKGHRKN